MKKKIFAAILSAGLLFSMSTTAFAETVNVNDSVSFTADNKMTAPKNNAGAQAGALQPGDTMVYTVDLTNYNAKKTDWYMKNTILQSLEQTAGTDAKNGAYTYKLEYQSPSGETVSIYDSETVGGENSAAIGLHEATQGLDDYFFLGTLESGASGKVVLTVSLDGETQGNAYQATLADLQLAFGTQIPQESTLVKTGDSTDMSLYYMAAGGCGVVLLALSFVGLASRKKEKEVQ